MDWQSLNGQVWTVDGHPFVLEYRQAREHEAWLGGSNPNRGASTVCNGATPENVVVLLPITKGGQQRVRPARMGLVTDPRSNVDKVQP